MIRDKLKKIIEGTNNSDITWEETSNPFSFCTVYDNVTYSVTSTPKDLQNHIAYFSEWDKQGEEHTFDLSEYEDLSYELFQIILKKDVMLKSNFDKYCSMEENTKKSSVSLHKLIRRLDIDNEKEHPSINIIKSDYFYYSEALDVKYIQPPMKQLNTVTETIPFSEATVVLISAPGATGKSAMANYISAKLSIPIYDLGKHEAVGANSVSGLLMRNIDQDDVFTYHAGLREGYCSMIIDGLDEAFIHITYDSFEAFMKDIAFFSKDAKGLPFVILGRPSVMEDAALSLEMNGVKTALLQIEPFTIDKAKDFIDKQVDSSVTNRFDKQYKDVRDYIIEEIGGFFKNESDMNNRVFERFIGYAPVLISINILLSDNKNYHGLLNELKEDKKQKIDLLIDIVNRILLREQKKIHEEVLPQFLNSGFNESYVSSIRNKCGTKEEQCQRILSFLVGVPAVFNIFDEEKLDEEYNEKMNSWIKNHPFINIEKKWFENIVFESYVIAITSSSFEDNKELIIKGLGGLTKNNSCSYLLADICYNMSNGKTVDYRMVPYLISSFKALDTPTNVGKIEIIATGVKDTFIECELNFGHDNESLNNTFREYDFKFQIGRDQNLQLNSPISNVNLDADINISIVGNSTEIIAPVSIHCNSITVDSRDILLFCSPDDDNIIIECNQFDAMSKDGTIPNITNYSNNKNAFKIFTDCPLNYPFVNYKENNHDLGFDDKNLFEMFQKFRRMLLMFRSHSNGILARCCSKIDKRIGKTKIGKQLIKKMNDCRILSSDGVMYYINYDNFASIIGAKYNDIRSCNISDKTRKFLSEALLESV